MIIVSCLFNFHKANDHLHNIVFKILSYIIDIILNSFIYYVICYVV